MSLERSRVELKIGSQQEVHAWVGLGSLTAEDVTVQLYHGLLDTRGEIISGATIDMVSDGTKDQDGNYKFTARISYIATGQHGVSVRVLPHNEDLPSPYQRGLIRWAE